MANSYTKDYLLEMMELLACAVECRGGASATLVRRNAISDGATGVIKSIGFSLYYQETKLSVRKMEKSSRIQGYTKRARQRS